MKLLSVVLVVFLALGADMASAKRLGGGASVGKQSGHVTQPQAAPMVAPAAVPAAASPKAAAPAGAPTPSKPWMGMLGGLAAGLGLAWLASSLGLGEVFGQLLLFGLLAVLAMAVLGWVLRKRAARAGDAPHGLGGLAYQGAAGRGGSPRNYSPQNVGNDASARPWERSTTGFEPSRFGDAPVAGGLMGSGLVNAPTWGIPQGFDVDAFLQASKTNFIGLQAAWDRSDIPSLRAMMTDDMLAQIKAQLADREQHSGSVYNVTEVVMLEARLLGIEELDHAHMASVEFSGMIREEVSAGPNPFREVWNITRPKSGSGGWLVAGVQALQ
ncbi:MAG: Tim44-like domain-containing protein [Burkholderiaceae bacterium]